MISKQQALYNLLKLCCGPAKPFDIALINETWLRKETVNKVSLPGYEVISKERIGKKEGGICAIVSNKLKHRQRHDLMIDLNKLEHLVIEIKTRCSSIIMVSAYHPPYVNAKEFINDYKNLLNKLCSCNKQETKCIIGIDHNMDFLKSQSHQPTQDFIELNLDMHMIPVISRLTRITKSSATLIDNLFVS